jgi:hypothetical protein
MTTGIGFAARRRPPAHQRRAVPVATLALGVVLTGCTSGGVRTEEPPSRAAESTAELSPASQAPSPGSEDRILLQYAAFWRALAAAGEADVSARRALLEPVAVDPELSRSLRGMRAADSLGQELYGAVVPRVRDVQVSGNEATVTDCQDASAAGRRRKKDGQVVTRGGERDSTEVTMRRDVDGTWRVATIDYRPDEQC